jgi:hypothetical protein
MAAIDRLSSCIARFWPSKNATNHERMALS